MSETRSDEFDGALEFEALKNFAWKNGFFCQIHRNFIPRPGQERNCWYLQKSNRHNPGIHQDTILKFSTAEEIRNWIVEYLAAEKVESPP